MAFADDDGIILPDMIEKSMFGHQHQDMEMRFLILAAVITSARYMKNICGHFDDTVMLFIAYMHDVANTDTELRAPPEQILWDNNYCFTIEALTDIKKSALSHVNTVLETL